VSSAPSDPSFSRLQLAQLRAQSLSRARAFFASRHVLEVETPILSQGISLDVHIDFFETAFFSGGIANGYAGKSGFLQTSPEPHLKRLLCEGFPDLYQISKSFRNGESGKLHNPEFTMVEWYRLGFDLATLEAETLEFCRLVGGDRPKVALEWEDAFQKYLGISPFEMTESDWREHPELKKWGVSEKELPGLVDIWDFMMSHCIEPQFDAQVFTVVRHFPIQQAAQSKPHPEFPHLSLRFEIYSGGMELANGYQELTASGAYRERFLEELKKRSKMGKPQPPIDERLLHALQIGLPECAGVAVGFDRLIQLTLAASRLPDVLLFPWGQH
jgi:elongation factor P--(R)-beta-lysine ligase